MRVIVQVALVATLLGLGGCATIVKGTTQDIALDTNPQGGNCNVLRAGAPVATITAPGIVKVGRGKERLTITCTKAPEFPTETAMTVDSKFNGATFGNILAGGVIGVVVDSSTGANYSYPDKVTVELAGTASATPVATTTIAPAATTTPADGKPATTAPAAATPAAKPEAPKATPAGSN